MTASTTNFAMRSTSGGSILRTAPRMADEFVTEFEHVCSSRAFYDRA
jgi:hypothetical protein